MTLLIVGIGGLCGSLTRYTLGKLINRTMKHTYPWGTFLINLTGAFLLGLVSNLTMDRTLLLLLADGFLGAYTTFSTFMYEGFHLLKDKKRLNAIIYILSSLFLGLLGYYTGLAVALHKII